MTYLSFKMFVEHYICNTLNSIEMYMCMHIDEKNYKYVEKYIGFITCILEKLKIIVVRQHQHFK